MPSIFLSPSAQEYNPYYDNSGSEEYYMNLIADAMEPYLDASGISFTRNNPNNTLSQIIRESNAGTYDLHLALHSNAAPEYLAGQLTRAGFLLLYPQLRRKKRRDGAGRQLYEDLSRPIEGHDHADLYAC